MLHADARSKSISKGYTSNIELPSSLRTAAVAAAGVHPKIAQDRLGHSSALQMKIH
jgi:hypothetical protein